MCLSIRCMHHSPQSDGVRMQGCVEPSGRLTVPSPIYLGLGMVQGPFTRFATRGTDCIQTISFSNFYLSFLSVGGSNHGYSKVWPSVEYALHFFYFVHKTRRIRDCCILNFLFLPEWRTKEISTITESWLTTETAYKKKIRFR